MRQVLCGVLGAAALALMLAMAPIKDYCDTCSQYYPYWTCVLLGCW